MYISIIGPLLFIIYICDLFIEYDAIEFASYADDTTPYTYGKSFDKIIEKLETDMLKICEWFQSQSRKISFFTKSTRRQTNKNTGIQCKST